MTTPLLVAIPLSSGTLSLADSLLRHLAKLGPIQQHAVLFVVDHNLTKEQFAPLLTLAQPIFPAGGELIHTPLDITPAYPNAHNFRFECAARHVSLTRKVPWFWLDPHCVPTRKSWLIEIETEYFSHVRLKPILGQLLTPETHGTAQPLISSAAVYPAELPKRMMQRLIAQRGTDWEKSCADLMVPIAHPSQLIWVHAVNGTMDLPKPPAIAAIVHTARAKEFAAQKEPAPAPKASEPIKAPAVVPPPLPPKPAEPPKPRTGFYHSGDLGDIVYALAAIRLAGGGALYLGPRLRKTPPPANPMREPVFELFKPLLVLQPYLTRVQFIDRYPGTDMAFDLNIFRERWGDQEVRARTGINNLARMHCHVLGVDEKFHPSGTWLTVPNPIETGMFTVHRSSRYHSGAGSPDGTLAGKNGTPFPWKTIVQRYAGKLLFVGQPFEHAAFQREFNCKTAFWLCQDFLELARVIVGSLGFIGNQSFPCSLAIAAGQRVLQESWAISPDCLFPRPNFLTQPLAEGRLDAWEKSPKLLKPITAAPPAPEPPPAAAVEITRQSRRCVSTEPIHGVIELGPQKDAYGLGDTLTITPLAARLGEKAVMVMPESMNSYACLFDGLCPVRVVPNDGDYPEFPPPTNPKLRFIETKLRQFGFECEDGKTVPVVRLWADELLFAPPKEVAFSTACSKRWEHIRTRPLEWWKPITDACDGKVILKEYNADIPLRQFAAQLKASGFYLGTNSGPWHLAMAMGCRCLVIDADECEGYAPSMWRYNLPAQCEYVGFDHANIIAKLPWLLGSIADFSTGKEQMPPAPTRRTPRRKQELTLA